MFRHFVPVIGVASVVAVAIISAEPTLSQINIDQGKPASELFANDCAACHKSTRGLANGRNNFTLSLFLREHYAASSQQAAALAAYVISAGGNAPAAKSERAKSEEPRGQDSKGHEAKPHAASASPKSEPEKPARGGQPAREEPAPTQQAPAQQEPAQQEPAPVVVAPTPSPPPSSAEAPELRPTTSAGVSAETQSNDDTPVPRDNIPD